MTDWILFLPPLLVLPIVLLFRFVGCGEQLALAPPDPAPPRSRYPRLRPRQHPLPPDTEKREAPPRYRNYIMVWIPRAMSPTRASCRTAPTSRPIGGWSMTIRQSRTRSAATRKDSRPASRKKITALPDVAPTNDDPGSEPRDPAHFNLGEDSLIESDPAVHCRFFEGAYVFVPHVPNLFHSQFTIEAWVRVGTLMKGYEHVLFDAGGSYVYPAGTPASPRGFRIVADRTNSWQVYVAPRETPLFAKPPLISPNSRAHLALTVADKTPGSTEKIATFYLNGKVVDVAVDMPSYAPPHEAPLFIGIENTRPVPSPTLLTLRHPALFRIQEVVLHRKALSQEEIFNHVDINRKVGAP